MKRLISFFLAIIALMGITARTSIFALSKSTGDVNGDGEVNNKDVVTLFRYVSGDKKTEDEPVYDFNNDGEVNNKDVVALFRALSTVNKTDETEEESEDTDEDVTVTESEITEMEEGSETDESNDDPSGRKEKNGFDAAEKIIYNLCGVEYKMPSYFVNDEKSSESRKRQYYAEKGSKVAGIKVDLSESLDLSRSAFELYIELGLIQELAVEGLSTNGDKIELVDNKIITVDGKKCCLFSIKGTISDFEITGKIFFSYVDRLKSMLSFILLQSDYSDFSYNNDFEKIIETIKTDC